METSRKPLEEKVEKINWKEWIPIYGVYQTIKNTREGRPSVIGTPTEEGLRNSGPLLYWGNIAYHAVAIGSAVEGIAYFLSN